MNKIKEAAETINHYSKYSPLLKLVDNKIVAFSEGDAGVVTTLPTTQQISALALEVVKENSPYQIARFSLLMSYKVFENPNIGLYELEVLSIAELLVQANKQFYITDLNGGDREVTITPILEKNVRSAASPINDFCHYKQQLKMVDFKITVYNDGDSIPGIALPTQKQIGTLILEVCEESKPYALVNFLTFISHIALYFPNANIYELELFGLANLVRGIKHQFTIN